MTNRLLLTMMYFITYAIIPILTIQPTTASAENISLPKIDRKPVPNEKQPREMKRLPKYDPDSTRPSNLDLRCRDLSKLDLRRSIEDLMFTDFDDRTVWPASNRMPSGFDWQKIMELGTNPGLGIRSLHQRGITGRGVRIAILDQPLLVDHQEYADRLQLYEEIHIQRGMEAQWHGPMVASIAVGKTIGVAPEAELFYIAQWNFDWEKRGSPPTLRYLAQGIYRILEINEQLPPDNKIRAISISKGWTRSDKDYALIAEAVQKAQAEGILMVFTSVELFNGGYDISKLGRSPLTNPDIFGSYGPAMSDTQRFWTGDFSPVDDPQSKGFYVPTDSRTTASPLGIDEYVFDRNGGSSKYPPYIAGLYALAVQTDAAITPERFWALAVETGRTIEIERDGKRRRLGPIIDPVRLIRAVETGELANTKPGRSSVQSLPTPSPKEPGSKTIVPGVSIGEFTLGMSKDEVLGRLGNPKFIYHGNERYTLDNLPRECRFYYGDIEFEIENNTVQKIMTHSSLYTLPNGLTVGDSADKVKQIFGTDYDGSGNVFRYYNKGLRFEFDEEERTLNEIRIFEPEPTYIANQIQLQGAESVGAAAMGETLYNGIRLTVPWPPAYNRNPREPMPVPYLDHPPDVIPIDVGRQLFVDDFLIQETTLKREFHRPLYHKANPIIKPDKPWENKSVGWFAAPFSGGAWYDPADRFFKIWYQGGFLASTCYATSKDGIHWNKPVLDVEQGTNIVLEPVKKGRIRVDTTTVWLDHDTKDPQARYKYFATEAGGGLGMTYRTSPDGIHWSGPVARHDIHGDRTTVFYNPFRKMWVLSERISWSGRARAYSESPDPKKLITDMDKIRRVHWIAADRLDPHHTDEKYSQINPQLYNLDAVPYESLMLGMFSIWQGPPNGECSRNNLQKRNDILLGFSRDGFHFSRPDRKRFIAATWDEKNWRYGNVQSVNGGCYVVGDKLYFYFSGRAKPHSETYDTDTIKAPKRDWDADAATGLAILRRDGFASMDIHNEFGTLTTRLVSFKGKYLFVNVDCPKGGLKAEVLDKDGKVIEPFTLENCKKVSCDKTLVPVTWESGDLSTLAGKPIRFRFHLNNGRFYSFWVSPDESGASHGFVGAGGPGFTDATDTVGIKAYR